MKRIFIEIIACFAITTLFAQQPYGNAYLMKDGDIVKYFNLADIDSITWHPFHVQKLEMPDTLRLAYSFSPSELNAFTLEVVATPYYTTDSIWYELSNNEVLRLNEPTYSRNIQHSGTLNMAFSGNTLGAGSTTFTIHVGDMQKTCAIIITLPSLDDIRMTDADSLFDNIYSRLTVTGNIQPDGDCDIQGIDEGVSPFYRMMFELNEFPADQLWWIWGDPGISELRAQTWKSDNVLITGLFMRLYKNIDFCNQYLDITEQNTGADVAAKRAETRFMRAFYYSYLLDMFGSVPIITTHVQTTYPQQATRTELFQFIVTELQDVASQLPMSGLRSTYYRVDRTAAWLLLSRLYLNGQIYTGADFYNEAAEYAKKVMDSNYKLATQYRNLFMGDNEPEYLTLGNTAAQEIILAAEQNATTRRSWGGSRFLICAFSDRGATPYTGCSDTWSCMRTKTNLVNLFFTDEEVPTIKDSITTTQSKDDRALFCSLYKDVPYKFNCRASSEFTDCWAVVKYTNLRASNTASSNDLWPDMNIPIMRKAEAYLTYAEALMRGAKMQGDVTALQAINTLRERANATQLTTLTLQDVLDEWGREFYAEGRRRSDLIRFGLFGGQSSYNWEGKAGKSGCFESSFEVTRNIYPIPAFYISNNPNMKQNAGY